MNSRGPRGVSRIGILVGLICAICIVVMALVMLQRRRMQARFVAEQHALRGIHQSWLVHAREFGGIFPTPGLIDRHAFNGVEEPGRGEEDVTQNTTANLHSAMIMQNFYGPLLLISPNERNPRVKVKAKDDYNFAAYNVKPDVDCYWDNGFTADLVTGSDVSFANLMLHGRRKDKQWRETLDSTFAVLGSRGPQDGKPNPKSFTCDSSGAWKGFIVSNDNSLNPLSSTVSPNPFMDPGGRSTADGFFAIDDGMHGGDVILSFTKAMSKDAPSCNGIDPVNIATSDRDLVVIGYTCVQWRRISAPQAMMSSSASTSAPRIRSSRFAMNAGRG